MPWIVLPLHEKATYTHPRQPCYTSRVSPRPPSLFLLRFLVVCLLFLVAANAAVAWYGYQESTALSKRITVLETSLATTTSALQQGIQQSQTAVDSALQQSNALADQVGNVQQQFGDMTNNVNHLEKLSKLDPQLLAKYSKIYFLNENYIPAHLTVIPKDFTYHQNRDYSILTDVSPYMVSMMNAAKQSNVTILIESSYRTFAEQMSLKNEYAVVYGKGTANQFSADQGYSEHQLATTVDFTTPKLAGVLTGFEKMAEYKWLNDNAYRFGFILSYPSGNSYYVFEPWHWRFVGVQLATYLHDNNKHFYDLDQREIDTYLANIFD
jgi:D-alanyl-D-alanine carboxypeptidase